MIWKHLKVYLTIVQLVLMIKVLYTPDILYNKYNIEDERTNEKSTMLLCGIGTNEKMLKKLKQALINIGI